MAKTNCLWPFYFFREGGGPAVNFSDFKITTGYAVVLGHERVNYHAL